MEYINTAREYELLEISLMQAREILRNAAFQIVCELKKTYDWEGQIYLRQSISSINNAAGYIRKREQRMDYRYA